MEIDCNVHVATYAATRGLGSMGGRLPKPVPLGLEGEFSFEYDYPLRKTATFVHALDGLNPRDILRLAAEDYKRIYAEERETTETEVGRAAGLLNRNATNGKRGIWGHDITDLFFESIHIDLAGRKVTFGMGS